MSKKNMKTKLKKCRVCNKVKTLNDFYVDKTMKDGICSQCKQCLKEYRENNKERISRVHKIHYQKNLGRWQSYDRIWCYQ